MMIAPINSINKAVDFEGYLWAITKDHIAEPGAKPGTNANAVGVYNSDFTPSSREGVKQIVPLLAFIKKNEDNIIKLIKDTGNYGEFKMYDDDGELYYEGIIMCEPGSESMFAPLDDFGAGNAGCTRIDYKDGKTGKFVTI